MRATAEIKKVIETRLKNYVSRDKTGIRREMLKLFLKLRSITIHRMFEYLNQKFSISYHSVAAMVGIVASRLTSDMFRRPAVRAASSLSSLGIS